MENGMTREASPAARALVALELIQNNPGITARRLADRLGVTDRAARRYVAILREADLPIESVSGPYGGYRVGRGLRLPPLMFTAAEALGLVMAVLDGHHDAADPADPVGGALAKIVRVLPERIARPVRSVRDVSDPGVVDQYRPSPELTTALIDASAAARRLRLRYRMGAADRQMEVDPWAVVLRHSRWYLLCWSHTRQERRVLRVDRIVAIETLPATFTPPDDLDALRVLEEHLSAGWTYPVDVLVDASVDETARWLPRSLARLEPEGDRTRLRASTDNPDWYARQLAALPAPFTVLESAELRRAMTALGNRLLQAAAAPEAPEPPEAPHPADPALRPPRDQRHFARISAAGQPRAIYTSPRRPQATNDCRTTSQAGLSTRRFLPGTTGNSAHR
jgi:predicted DNA-binding transcriptional regulator YafY